MALSGKGLGMLSRAAKIIDELCNRLKHNYASWQVTDLEVVGFGLDNLLCRANTTTFGPVAVRAPWNRWISNDNDENLDARELLQQEVMLASHLGAHGVATPKVYSLHLGEDDFDFMVSMFIDHDQSSPDARQFGQLMKAIHGNLPPNVPLVIESGLPINEVLAERLVRRLRVVERQTRIELDIPELNDVKAMLEWEPVRRCVLHMDARPENILTQEGTILAIVDWANALIGDPALELARIAEYGYLSKDFLIGYGDQNCFAHIPPYVELLYRLDTAVMLAVVFLAEAPDPHRAKIQVKRVIDICAKLKEVQ
jgi:hypothetical protein